MTQHERNSLPAETGDPPRGSVWKFATGAAGIAVLLAVYYASAWQSIDAYRRTFSCSNLFCDFVTYFYPMGEAILRTELPVDGFLYSPFAAILLAVFPPLGLNAALVLWGILQVVFVFLYLLLFRWLVPARLLIQLLLVALVLSSYPVVLNFLGGGVCVFMIVALLGMLAFNGRGHRAAAAGLLIFAVSFKFYPIIFLAPFAARRDTRFLLFAVAACVLFLFVFPALLLGGGDMLRFYGGLLDAFRDSDWVVANPHSQYFPHVVLRLAGVKAHDWQTYLPLLRWIGFGIVVANMGLVLLVERARLSHAGLWSFQVVCLTIPFVLKTSWAADFYFLSFTQTLLAWRLLEGRKAARLLGIEGPRAHAGPWRAWIPHRHKAVAFFLLLPSIVLSNIVFFNLVDRPYNYGFCGLIFWADVLLLVALYMELLPPALRRLCEPHTG